MAVGYAYLDIAFAYVFLNTIFAQTYLLNEVRFGRWTGKV